MGLAASQARLLSITSRLSDNELRAQLINNQKIRLATESANASDAYVAALSDAKMMFTNYDADNNKSYQDLTFNALTAFNPYNNQYGLSNQNGSLLVSERDAYNFKSVKDGQGGLTEFLKLYGLEQKTTYFDTELSKYLGDDGNVSLGTYVDEVTGEEVNISSGLTPADLEILYFGGMTSDGIQHESYEADVQSPKFIEYDAAVGRFDLTYNKLVEIGTPYVQRYVANLALNQDGATSPDEVSISSESTRYIKNKINDLYPQQEGDNVSQADLDKAAGYLKAMGKIFTTIQGKFTDSGSDEYKFYQNLIDSVNNYKVGESYGILEPTGEGTSPGGIPYINIGKEGSYTSYIGLDGLGNAKFYKKDANGSFVLDDERNSKLGQWQSGTEGGESSRETLSVSTDSNGNKVINHIEESSNVISTKKYVVDSSGNISGDETIDILDNTSALYDLAGFVDGLLNYFYHYYMSNIDYTDLPEDIFKDLAGNDDPEGYNVYKTAQEDYEEAGKNLSEVVFGQDIGFDDYDILLDPRLIEDYDIPYLPEFQTVIDYTHLEDVFNVYGEPKFAWVDSTDPSGNADAEAKAKWYTNLYNRMQSGYVALQDGLASSKEWIKFALQSGLVVMEQVDQALSWNSFEYACCSDITEQTDSVAVTKAEAEYNQKMNEIQAKDQRFDLELKNIDTEHTSLQTEYESIKSVIDKNVERTFKIYS